MIIGVKQQIHPTRFLSTLELLYCDDEFTLPGGNSQCFERVKRQNYIPLVSLQPACRPRPG